MAYNNPPVPWRELERRLSDRPGPGDRTLSGDGGDGPAWSRKRPPYQSAVSRSGNRAGAGSAPRHPYAELHCHSAFSFLDGASTPEELAEEATRLGLEALAITDHHGFYGVVRFAEAARVLGLPSVFGAELTIGDSEARQGPADPRGRHLVVLARDPEGYARLSTLLSAAQMAGTKGHPKLSFADVAEAAGRARGHWAVLTGCRKGTVPAALVEGGPAVAQRELRSLVAAFGVDNTFVELWDHGDPTDSVRNDGLVGLAAAAGVQPVVTNNVHYAQPSGRRLASAMAAVRARRSMAEIDPWLASAGMAHLRSGAEQHRRFGRYPGVVAAAAALGRDCAFDLSLVAPSLPPFPCPAGPDGSPRSEAEYLRHLTTEGATRRYGPRHAERTHGAWDQIDRELELICSLGFPGYFLVVWDLVEFCRR
ncbi:MAG: PHP domain-containing protein, partial [Microthrixaceae bacterium]